MNQITHSRPVVLGLLLLFLGVGYVAGKHRLLGRLRDSIIPSRIEEKKPPFRDPRETKSYGELDRFLQDSLRQRAQDAALWRDILKEHDPAKRRALADQIRKRLQAPLQPWPAADIGLDAQEEPWFSNGRVEVSYVRIQTFPGVRLLTILLVPRNRPPKLPALLVLHGLGGRLESLVADVDYHHGFAMSLAEQGFLVLAPVMSAWNFTELNVASFKAQANGWSLAAIDLWQLRRAFDYLSTRPEADPTHLGIYGVSWGGRRALHLGALDQRVSLVVCSGHFADRLNFEFERDKITAAHHVIVSPGIDVLLDDVNLAAAMQPRFLAFELGERDERIAGARKRFPDVELLYQRAGFPQRVALLTFKGGHETSVPAVLPFLRRWAGSSETSKPPRVE